MTLGVELVVGFAGDSTRSVPASAVVLDLNFVALVSSVLSVVLGFFAIWLSWQFKKESDRVGKATTDLLVEIRSDARAIASFAAGELQKYGDIGRTVILGSMSSAAPGTIDTRSTPTARSADAERAANA